MDLKFEDWYEFDGERLITRPTQDQAKLTDVERIQLSIIKFQGLKKWAEEHALMMPSWWGTQSCPLCWKHYDDHCDQCPITLKTGHRCCHETPYDDFMNRTQETFPALCDAEIAFLQSLL